MNGVSPPPPPPLSHFLPAPVCGLGLPLLMTGVQEMVGMRLHAPFLHHDVRQGRLSEIAREEPGGMGLANTVTHSLALDRCPSRSPGPAPGSQALQERRG